MKKFGVFFGIFIFLFTATATMAFCADFPTTSKWAGMKGADVPLVINYDAQTQRHVIRIPISGDQPGNMAEGKVYVYIRALWNPAEGWFQFRDMEAKILEVKKRQMTVAFDMPKKVAGAPFYRIRMVGHNPADWLWIIQDDDFARLNTDGEIAYEWIINQGRVMAAGKDIPLWIDDPPGSKNYKP